METPFMEVVRFNDEDIISTSGGENLYGGILVSILESAAPDGWVAENGGKVYYATYNDPEWLLREADLYNSTSSTLEAGKWYHFIGDGTHWTDWDNKYVDLEQVTAECTHPTHHGLAASGK